MEIGLRDSTGGYLTAEMFNFALGSSIYMKRKQIFFMEHGEGDTIYLRTHLGRYLTFKENGKFLADAPEKGPEEALTPKILDDGRWTFKTTRGYYIGGLGNQVDAYTKDDKRADRIWTVRLAMHPQVCMRNAKRKRYVHLVGDELVTDEIIPWNADAMLSVSFVADGTYTIQADDGRFLTHSGELVARSNEKCKYVLEYDFLKFMFAFRTAGPVSGAGVRKYLTSLGAKGNVKIAREGAASIDELYDLQDSQPQFKLKLVANKQYASIKRGIEVQCNESIVGDTEIFQFNMDPVTKKWTILGCTEVCWSCKPDGSIQCVGNPDKFTPTEVFTVEWMGPHLALRASNGNFVTMKENGGCCVASTNVITDYNTFIFELINRPTLVLRGEFGFVGANAAGVLECNHSMPEMFSLHITAGMCKISGSNGKYWRVGVNNVTVSGDEPDLFTMEFVEPSKFLLKAPNGKYLAGQQVGEFTATGTKMNSSTLWEY